MMSTSPPLSAIISGYINIPKPLLYFSGRRKIYRGLAHTLAVFIALVSSCKLNAQSEPSGKTSPFAVKPSLGIANGLGNFRDYALPGYNIDLAVDFLRKRDIDPKGRPASGVYQSFINRFGLICEFNYFRNEFRNLAVLKRIPQPSSQYTVSSNVSGSWKATVLSIGPTYIIPGIKFTTDFYSKAGIAFVTTPEAWAKLEVNTMGYDFFRLNQQRLTSVSLTTGVRFNYRISPHISVFLNPQHVITNARVQYSLKDAEQAFSLDQNGEEIFNPGKLVEQKMQEKTLNPNYLTLNAGISIRLGKEQPRGKTPLKDKFTCSRTEWIGKPGDVYITTGKTRGPVKYRRPDFAWADPDKSSKTKYTFKFISDNGTELYSKTTKKSRITHSKKIESVYQSYFTEQKQLKVLVIKHSKGCGDISSEALTLTGSNRSTGLVIDFKNSICRNPAFDQNGKVHYDAEVLLINPAGNTSTIEIPACNFAVDDASGNNSVTVIQGAPPGMGGIIPPCPIILPPGTQQTVYFSYSQPIGQTIAFLNVPYHTTESSVLVKERDKDSLPNCICNICDNWNIQSSDEQFWRILPNASNLRIRYRNAIVFGNAVPVISVKAEIVYVKQISADSNCSLCNNNDNHMGMFAEAANSGRVMPATGWVSSGKGVLRDENSDGFGNQYTWTSSSENGVDMSAPRNFYFNISLPPISKLSCCSAQYEICVRYTFTNSDCRTCSFLDCFIVDEKASDDQDDGPIDVFPDDEKAPIKN